MPGKWMVLSSDYHGHGDEFVSLSEPALGVPTHEYVKTLKDDYTEEDIKNCDAVIIEPVKLNVRQNRKEWLKSLDEVCKKYNTILIFDEVITGFRVPKHSVGQMWNLNPEITVLGKSLANGFPLAVVGGKEEVMDCGDYFISSTYSGDAVALAACKATLETMTKEYSVDDLWFYGNRLRMKLNDLHPDIQFEGYNTRAQLNLFESETAAIFAQECAKAGIFFGRAWFYNYAHLEQNVEEYVMSICNDVVSRIKRGECKLEGPMPSGSFKR